MEQELNIYQKLAKIRKLVEVMRKNRKGFNYTYVGEDEILARISSGLDKYNLSLVPEIDYETLSVNPYQYLKTKFPKGSSEPFDERVNEVLVHGGMRWRWVNNDNPEEFISVPWVFVGHQGDASQAFGAGLTYASRYFLLKYFNIATPNDDPDEWKKKKFEASIAEEKEASQKIIDEVHKVVTSKVSEDPESRKDILKIIKKYVSSGNYNEIYEVSVATKLFEELNKKYKKEED